MFCVQLDTLISHITRSFLTCHALHARFDVVGQWLIADGGLALLQAQFDAGARRRYGDGVVLIVVLAHVRVRGVGWRVLQAADGRVLPHKQRHVRVLLHARAPATQMIMRSWQ